MTNAEDRVSGQHSKSSKGGDYVTFVIGEQLFGVPVTSIDEVFTPVNITPVPLSSADIAGVLNLRGRVVTAIDVRHCLGLPPRAGDETPIAIGIEKGSESYGLLIDAVGEVLTLSADQFEPTPSNLEAEWQQVAQGIYRLDESLLVVLDIDRLLNIEQQSAA